MRRVHRPLEATTDLYNAASEFFSQRDEDKMRWCLHQGYGAGGFVPRGVEAVGRSHAGGEKANPDPLENLVFSHGADPAREVVPSHPVSLQPAVARYTIEVRRVLSLLLALSASALGLPEGHFDQLYDARASCNLKLAWYPALGEDHGEQLRYAAHTDCALPFCLCVPSGRAISTKYLFSPDSEFLTPCASATVSTAPLTLPLQIRVSLSCARTLMWVAYSCSWRMVLGQRCLLTMATASS
mmetsp:Transcript_4467/g.12525  ORF Transcript_4467/g.12525 Transcript_4467/m.12525 type:complete len:241 (+) Transcript_4467:130-852(+)